jgi:translation initiation factor 2 beta subunit (eIF-2beta)/eIF-5
MKNIHLIPTDKPTGIFESKNGLHFSIIEKIRYGEFKGFNIYITNDEDIKEGDWFVQVNTKKIIKHHPKNGLLLQPQSFDKKIILTTDQDLIKDGLQAIDDEFLEWFVKNPSCERVEVERLEDGQYFDRLADGSVIEGIYENYKIIIPQEEPKQTIIMKNIHLIPTDKPSKIALSFEKLFFNSKLLSPILYKNQNIYITNDLEIKEGDWHLNIVTNKISKYNIGLLNPNRSNYKKIILTDNKDLIKDGLQAIDDEFLEWFVKNPTCEEVDLDTFSMGNKVLYNVVFPKEKQIKCYCGHTITCDCEPLQETLEEAAERLYPFALGGIGNVEVDKKNHFIKGAKWQQQRMYSEEDMINFAHFYFKEEYNLAMMEINKTTKELLSEWFEQFKKK